MPFGESASSRWSIVVHGGAGPIAAERARSQAEGCSAAVAIGAAVLREGGAAIDAVEAAVRALEDDPRYNAGRGACLNEEGLVELDASIMEGARLRAGAVAALPPFAHPIAIARAALEDGAHVLYAGEGAARFARAHGFVDAPLDALRTDAAISRWNEVRARREAPSGGGTVGAVAKDAHGHVAAATSTGGTVDKRVGRVGDSSILGAGTYADDARGAVSTTGKGESFIRVCFAARMVDALDRAAGLGDRLHAMLEEMRTRVGGDGGAIVVDADGRVAWAHVSASMAWAFLRNDGTSDEARASA